MYQRFANVFLALSLVVSVAAVSIAYAAQPVPVPQAPVAGCLWVWSGPAYGWVCFKDNCFGFCNPPDRPGEFEYERIATPCLGCP